MEYYVFPNQAAAQACVDFINGTSWFPIVGQRRGHDDPSSQTTTKWMETPTEMLSGEYAVNRIPESRLDALEVPQSERSLFINTFGNDIRTLTSDDFAQEDTP